MVDSFHYFHVRPPARVSHMGAHTERMIVTVHGLFLVKFGIVRLT